MARKSNKTEHVLKLISKEDPETAEQEETAADQAETPAAESETAADQVDALLESLEAAAGPSGGDSATKSAAEAGHGLQPGDSTLLINIAEQMVRENIHEVMERLNVCTCPVCTNDVAALALNMLPQKYITTNTGKQFTQMEMYKKQYETDVLAALTKACVRVKSGPRHG